MNYGVYLLCAISFYIVIVFLAMVLKDISSIFDFVSAYSVSCISFFIPAGFYRKAISKFNIEKNPEISTRLTISVILLFMGALNTVLGLTAAIIVVSGLEEE